MTPVAASSERPEAPLFSDGIGDRVVASDGASGELLQILKLRTALTAVPSFEFALRERTARLANFRHAYYSRVRRIDRAMTPTPSLAVVSDHVDGIRLSEILRVARDKHLQLDINAALCLIRQLVPAVALLHENARDVAHGLIAPERLVVTPHARMLIVEHVLGAAVEQLHWSRERLWREFRVAVPPTAGVPRFDHRADVVGTGVVALALVLGRPIGADEFPQQIPMLLETAREGSALGDARPLSSGLRQWLARALQLDVRRAFASAPEALAALDDVLADDSVYVAAPIALETFLSKYIEALTDDVLPSQRSAPARPPAVSTAVVPETAMAPPIAASRPVTDFVDLSDLAVETARSRDSSAAQAGAGYGRSLFNADEPFTPAEIEPPGGEPSAGGPRRWLPIAAAVLLVAALGGGFAAYKFLGIGRGAAATGTLVVQSTPAGVPVFVDGIDRGVTPARVALPAGAHILELRGKGVPRVIPLTVTSGAEVSQYLEFAETPETGQLSVQSEPAGARVFVDGTERGVAPLMIQGLAPGEHTVVLQTDGGTVKQAVVVQAGALASVVAPVSAAAPGPVSGWVSLKAPFTIEIYERDRLVGSSDADRVMLASGRHELEFANDPLGLRMTRTVHVTPGKVTPIALDLPRGVVHLNASPWAEVWIDGQRAGDTPLGNIALTIGAHEIVFRHPQLGEKRHAVSVTAGVPVRLSVNMQ
jgi:PEGA domain